jgi:hypothetical protein
MNLKIKILKDKLGNITVSFPYNPQFVQKIKTIKRHRWHLNGKYWSFPNTNGILERILKVFEGEKIYIDPVLQSKEFPLPLVGEGKGEGEFKGMDRRQCHLSFPKWTKNDIIVYEQDKRHFAWRNFK